MSWSLYRTPDLVVQMALLVKEQEYSVYDGEPPTSAYEGMAGPLLNRHDDWIVGREACLLYLDAVCPVPRLLPDEPFLRARVWMLYRWIDGMDEPTLTQTLPDLYAAQQRHGGLLLDSEPKLCDLILAERLLSRQTGEGWNSYLKRLLPHRAGSSMTL